MMLVIPGVLDADQLADGQRRLAAADWAPGPTTAGAQAAQAKHNRQLPGESMLARELGEQVLAALTRHPRFVSAVLPKQVLAPLFNRYDQGCHFDAHVDNAIRYNPHTGLRLRTDVSTTVFLNPPGDYDGGELVVEDAYGSHSVKLAAGDAIVYPATSLHRVTPVTRGTRLAAFLWSQSLVRDDWQRHMLYDLDQTIQRLRAQHGDSPEVIALTSHYHNLLRQWAEL